MRQLMLETFAVPAPSVLDEAKLISAQWVQPDSRQSQQLQVQGSGHMLRYPRFSGALGMRALRF